MEDNFSELLMDSLVKNLLLPQRDQFGNQITNPIDQSVNKWAQNHKDEILAEVSKLLTIEVLSDKIAEKMVEQFKGWSYYERNENIAEINIKITEKLAERIASRIDIDKSI